jgi:hypothetical protein
MNNVASWLAGIMTFIGSIFGYHAQAPVQSMVNQPVEQVVQSTSTAEMFHATTTQSTLEGMPTSTLKTYHDDLFGYEIQYPDTWTVRQENGGVSFYKNYKEDIENQADFSVDVTDFNKEKGSLKEWVLSEPYSFNSDFTAFAKDVSMQFKSEELDGNQALDIISKGCKENTFILRENLGLVFGLTYPGRNNKMSNPCLTSVEAESIGKSFIFKGPSLRKVGSNMYSFLTSEIGSASGVTQESIEKDFKNRLLNDFCETKDQIFFSISSESERASPYAMLDKKTQKYYQTNFSARMGDPNVSLEQTCPYYLTVSGVDSFSSTTVGKVSFTNLITGEEKEVFRTNKDESLFAGYGEYDVSYPSISLQDKNTLKIEVFKQYKSNEDLMTTAKDTNKEYPNPEKLREVLIKFRE